MKSLHGSGLNLLKRSNSVADLLVAAASLVKMRVVAHGCLDQENAQVYSEEEEKCYKKRRSESSPVLDSTVLFSSEASSEDGDEVPTIMTEEVFKSYIEWDLEAKNRSEIVIVTAEEE